MLCCHFVSLQLFCLQSCRIKDTILKHWDWSSSFSAIELREKSEGCFFQKNYTIWNFIEAYLGTLLHNIRCVLANLLVRKCHFVVAIKLCNVSSPKIDRIAFPDEEWTEKSRYENSLGFLPGVGNQLSQSIVVTGSCACHSHHFLGKNRKKNVVESLISHSETWQAYCSVGLSKPALSVIFLVTGLLQCCKRKCRTERLNRWQKQRKIN